MVTTDGPKKSVSAGGDSFFNRFSINGSRRNSAISSISSIDKFGLAEFDTSVSFYESYIAIHAFLFYACQKVNSFFGDKIAEEAHG